MGPMFWPELHHPRVAPDLAAEAAWMETFTDKIGCGECKTHWLEPLQTMPPKFASREAYFAWTVEAHNVVNRRLGKPLMSIGAAKELYA